MIMGGQDSCRAKNGSELLGVIPCIVDVIKVVTLWLLHGLKKCAVNCVVPNMNAEDVMWGCLKGGSFW
jgi:hypothetical protein